MSAFDDNPFAEDDDESLSYKELASKKRRRGDDTVGAQALTWPSEWQGVSGQLTAAAVQPRKEMSLKDTGDTSAAEIIPTATLLAEYEAGREEDEFNALVVRAAGLESEIKQQEKAYSDEISCVTNENEGLRESVKLLKDTILRIRQDIDAVCVVQTATNIDGNMKGSDSSTSSSAMGLLAVIQKETGALIHTDTELTRRLASQDCSKNINEASMAHIRSCIVGDLDDLLDLSSFDPQAESDRIRAIEFAVSNLSDDGAVDSVVPLMQALVADLKHLVVRYGELHTVAEVSRNRATFMATALHELVRDSQEWYTHGVNRAIHSSNGNAVISAYDETHEGIFSNQELEVTLHQMESALNQFLPIVPETASHLNAPSVAAAAAVSSCGELESYTEALGREVLWLRKLIGTDTATLVQHLSESPSIHGEYIIDTSARAAGDKTRWLMALKKALLERVAISEVLWRSLSASTDDRSAPAVDLQILFYRQFVALQEKMLEVLSNLNTTLRERTHIISTTRQVALHDGDDEAFAVLAEKVLHDSDCDVSGLHEELKKVCDVMLQNFKNEAAELLRVQTLKTEQSTKQLQEVRQLFARSVELIDNLVYGEASSEIGKSLAELPVVRVSEAPECSLKMTLEPCENAATAFLQVASSDHDQELREEVRSVRQRNEELVKCMKWLSMQSSHSAVPQLCAVRREIDALKHKLAISAQREAKWEVMKDDVDAVRNEVVAVQSATATIQEKLDDLRSRIAVRGESSVPHRGK